MDYDKISVIYVAINKCANTSFKCILSKYEHILIPHNNIKGMEDSKNLYKIKDFFIWNKCFKFTVVRNPVNRFLSALNFFCSKGFISNTNTAIDYIIDIIQDDDCGYDLFESQKTFIKRHTLPVTHNHYCLMRNEKLDINYFIKLEELSLNYKNLCKKINIDYKELPILNWSQKIFDVNSLSEKHLNFIKNFYKKDFVVFKY